MVKTEIVGLYVNLSRGPLRIAVNRKVDYFHERYDIHTVWEKIDLLFKALELLTAEAPDFLPQLETTDEKYHSNSPHRSRRYVCQDKEKLYPGRTDLQEKYSRKIGDQWVVTNIGMKEIGQILREACEAAEIKFGGLSHVKL